VPKSRVRKKPQSSTARPLSTTSSAAARAAAPSPPWYPIAMTVVLVVGLAYLVTYYLTSNGTSPHIGFMAHLGPWNFAVGFGIMIAGLVMAVRWR
jgi:hypothetical protein